MSNSELKEAINSLGDTLNNVIRRELPKYGYKGMKNMPLEDVESYAKNISPSMKKILNTVNENFDGDLMAGNLPRNKLINKVNFLNKALQYKTLRYAGFSEYRFNQLKMAENAFGTTLTNEESSFLWTIFNDFMNEHPNYRTKQYYQVVMNNIAVVGKSILNTMSIDEYKSRKKEALDLMLDLVKKDYEMEMSIDDDFFF